MREMIPHGKHKNLSFFAFTATPKNKTLEMFGDEYADGSFHPFHIYSMRQAIEEHFILDVLENYTTYKTCFQSPRTPRTIRRSLLSRPSRPSGALRNCILITYSRRQPLSWRPSGT